MLLSGWWCWIKWRICCCSSGSCWWSVELVRDVDVQTFIRSLELHLWAEADDFWSVFRCAGVLLLLRQDSDSRNHVWNGSSQLLLDAHHSETHIHTSHYWFTSGQTFSNQNLTDIMMLSSLHTEFWLVSGRVFSIAVTHRTTEFHQTCQLFHQKLYFEYLSFTDFFCIVTLWQLPVTCISQNINKNHFIVVFDVMHLSKNFALQ